MYLNGQISHNFNFLLLKMTLANEARKIMSGMFMEYPKWVRLWGLISTTEITHIFKDKTRFILHFPHLNVFVRTTMLAEYCSTDLETISLKFSPKKRGWQLA